MRDIDVEFTLRQRKPRSAVARLLVPVQALAVWAQSSADAIRDAQARFDSRRLNEQGALR